MTATAFTLCLAMVGATLLLWRRVGLNLSLTSVLLSLLLLFYGPAYFWYTRVYGPDTDFFDVIMASAKGQPVLDTLDLALALTFACVCLGVLAADLLLGIGRRQWRASLARWNGTPLHARGAELARLRLLAAVSAVCVLIPFLFIDGQLPKVLEYFTADLTELEKVALRREGGQSGFYLYNLLLATFFPFLAFCLLAARLGGGRRLWPWILLFLALVGIGKAAQLSKAPLAVFALQCAIVWLLCRRLTLSWRTTGLLVGLATLLFMAMAIVANPSEDDVTLVLDFLFYRVFMVVNESLVEYFAAIPSVLPHTWGAQSTWIATLFQNEPQLPTYWLVGEVHRGQLGTTATAMFMGDAWADFAWFGVVLTALLAGFVVRALDIQLIVRKGKSVATVAGLATALWGVFFAMNTSFQTALVTGGLLFVLPFVALVRSRRARSAALPGSVRPALR